MKPKAVEKQTIEKRSVIVSGHRTSCSVEDEFWEAFKQICERHGKSVNTMISEIDKATPAAPNLSSALRVFVLNDALSRAASPVTYKSPAAA